jgi:hypothetical protein
MIVVVVVLAAAAAAVVVVEDDEEEDEERSKLNLMTGWYVHFSKVSKFLADYLHKQCDRFVVVRPGLETPGFAARVK